MGYKLVLAPQKKPKIATVPSPTPVVLEKPEAVTFWESPLTRLPSVTLFAKLNGEERLKLILSMQNNRLLALHGKKKVEEKKQTTVKAKRAVSRKKEIAKLERAKKELAAIEAALLKLRGKKDE